MTSKLSKPMVRQGKQHAKTSAGAAMAIVRNVRSLVLIHGAMVHHVVMVHPVAATSVETDHVAVVQAETAHVLSARMAHPRQSMA